MSKSISLVLVCTLLVCAGVFPRARTASAAPVTLSFDDIVTSPTGPVDVAMPTNYGGLQWENFRVVNGDYPPLYGTGFKLGRASAPNTAYNAHATPATIASAAPFDVISAYFAVAYASTDEASEVQIEGFAGGCGNT